MIAAATRWIVFTTLVAAASHGQPTADVARQANALLRDGDAQAALALYGETTGELPLSPLVAYDKACAHLALGQVAEAEAAGTETELGRFRRLTGAWRKLFLLFSMAGALLAVNQIFNLKLFVGVVILDNSYL